MNDGLKNNIINDNMKKFLKYLLVALVAIVFLGTFIFLFVKSKPKEAVYHELTVGKGDIQRTTVVTGKIEPRNEVNVKPQINGIIAELYKEAGQQVERGEVIAKLTVIPDMNSLSAAQSRVRLAEINLKQAQTNLDREKALYEKDLVSAEEYDKVEQQLNQAKEERAAAQEALEVVRDGVSKSNAKSSSTLVRSTITGLILDIPVKVGNSVIQANTMNDGTTVATVANMNDLIFDGHIDETEVGALEEGMPVLISIGALQDYSFDATLEYISPKAVENNGANQFEIKDGLQALSVSESALEFSGDSTFVYKKGADGTFVRTAVTTGVSDGINIEIKDGLQEGDIVRGNQIIEEK